MLQQPLGTFAVEGTLDALAVLLAGDPLLGAKVHLYKATFAPTRANVYADFLANECDFTGYASSVLTWSVAGTDASGNPTALSNRAFFQATDALAPNEVGGVFITHDVTGPPATHTVIEFFPLNTPVLMTTAGAFVGVVIGAQMPGVSGYAVVDS